jgi:hypothetical protein
VCYRTLRWDGTAPRVIPRGACASASTPCCVVSKYLQTPYQARWPSLTAAAENPTAGASMEKDIPFGL